MKSKHVVILAAILVLLIAGIVFKKTQHRPELATQQYLPLEMHFETDQVSKIIIESPASKIKDASRIELIKEAGVWRVEGPWSLRADPERVQGFLNEIHKAKGELRSTSKYTHPDFEISDERGVHVRLAGIMGKEILNFVVGSKKSGYGGLFVRKKDSDSVYLTEADIYGQMGIFGNPDEEKLSEEFWALRKYAFFDPGVVEKIEITKFQKGAQVSALVLEKTGGKWSFSEKNLPFAPDAEKVSLYLNVIKNNPADKVLDPKAKDYGFQTPRARIRMTMRSGNPKEITVGNADAAAENAFYLQSSGENAVYLVSKYVLENLLADSHWFASDNPLGADNSKIEKLLIHADKTEKRFQPQLKKWDSLTAYMNGLKDFKIEKAVPGKHKFGKYWIEIQKQGEPSPLIIDVAASPVTEGEKKFYPAQRRGSPHLFSITPSMYSHLFENLTRLDEPK